MHFPDAMLQGSICPITATISAVGIAAAVYYGMKSENKPTASQFAAISALIFACQMMNFPIANGTSGHLLGGVLAASILGTPFGILAIALVVTIQSLVFSDGGITVLGANLFNMALIGAGVGGFLYSGKYFPIPFEKGKLAETIKIAVAAYLSVVLAACAVSIELALDEKISFSTVLSVTLIHALIGVGEALITVLAYLLIAPQMQKTTQRTAMLIPVFAASLIALLLSPFASSFPDGLEWVAQKYQFLHESAPAFVAPLSDYTFPLVNNELVSTGLAGFSGVIVVFVVAFLLRQFIGLLAARQQTI